MKQSDSNKIAINTANIKNIEKTLDRIELQLTNHIPTQLRALDKKITDYDKALNEKITDNDKAMDKRVDAMSVQLTSIVTIVTVLVQVAFQYFG